jgi:phosphate-selective porin OprO/OprP
VLSGRFQVDQANVDSGDADWSDLDLRRFRFGAKLRLFESVTFHTEAEFDPQGGDLGYERLTDTYVQWSPSDALALTVGKHGVAFTMDGQTSSKQLLAIDRSNLSNNIWFTDEYISGISVSGEMSQFVYNVGVFTSGAKDRGFGDSNGGEFVLATIGRDFGSRLSANEALLRFNYVDNEPDPNNSFTRSLEKIASLNFSFERDRWGVRSDVSSARGYLGQSDLVGLMVMPFLNLSDKKQLVFRYTLLDSDDPNGVRFARYERELASGRGDDYREFYAGFNYYWYGHKLKLQTGLTYADMSDIAADGGAYTGWSWTTGFRVSW